MPVEEPDVIPSEVDPDYECVRIGGSEHPGPPAEPPPGPEAEGERESGRALCPEGYVPRRRRRPRYELDGKKIRSTGPAERNPNPPPEDS
jgi:hypothetical protein